MSERLRNRGKKYLYTFGGVGLFGLFVAFLSPYISLDICTLCTYAEGDNEALLESIRGMEFLLKTLYLLMRPLIAIAGASLDNSLVYGEIFFLDTMLWKFRQIIRNFVNFGIGLVFIGSILASFFYQNNEKFSLPKIIKNTLLAGILVQMSWFIVAVLLDLSTIGIVGLGSLPMTVLDNSQQHALQQIRYLKPHTLFNLDGTKQDNADYTEHAIIYSCTSDGASGTTVGTSYYAPCWVKDDKFILSDPTLVETESRESYLQRIENVWDATLTGSTAYENLELDPLYCVWDADLLALNVPSNPDNPDAPTLMHNQPANETNVKRMRDAGKDQMKSCSQLDDYITKGQGMTGPLFLLFAVIMDMGEIAITTTTTGLTEAVFHFAIRAFIGVALMIPLAVMAVVLIIRSVILWLVIAFSPLLVLVFVYDFKSDGAQIGGGNLTNISDVLTLIFFPIFVVFAISLSVVFMTLISRIDFIKDGTTCDDDPMQLMGCNIVDKESCNNEETTNNSRTYDCFGVQFTLNHQSSNMGANVINTMSWLVKNFLGIALMWAIIFAALKMNKMTATIVSSVESFGKRLAMSTPIVPTGNGRMSLGGMQKAGEKIQNLPNEIASNQYDSSPVKGWIEDFEQDVRGETKETNKELEEVSTKASAAKVLEKGGVSKTNVTDYDKGLANTLGHYANQPPGAFTSVEEALKNPEVIAALANGGDNMSLKKFIEKWHTEQNGYKEYEKEAALKHMATGTAAISGVHAMPNTDKDDKHVYSFTGDEGQTRVVTYARDVKTGNYTGVETSSLSAGGLTTQKDIEVLGGLVTSHGGDIDKIATILGSTAYTQDISSAMNAPENKDKKTFDVPTVSGGQSITYKVTRNETNPNEVASISYVSGGKKDADGDGTPDDEDAFKDDPNESKDTDGDGVGDNADLDDDNDGYSDELEKNKKTKPDDATDTPDGEAKDM